MWQVIRQLCPDSNPHCLLVDFERAAINTFKKVWPMTFIKGCFFHLAQSVHRKIQEFGLKTLYSNNAEFSLAVRMLPALAYLPPQFFFTACETQIPISS